MVYPAEVEVKLGFDVLRQRLHQYCISGLGHREVDQLFFQTDYFAIQVQLDQVQATQELIASGLPFPGGSYDDPQPLLERVVPEGSFLEEAQLWSLIQSLDIISQWRAFAVREAERFPALAAMIDPASLPAGFLKELMQPFDESGKLRDQASPELARIRKRLREEQSRVRRLVDSIYRKSVEQGWVPEGASPTLRDGRMVIPVLAEHKRKLSGFLADESATGQTVFIEPAEVLEGSNEIRDLQHEERREIVRILMRLTQNLRDHLPEVLAAYAVLAKVELVLAKARLARDLRATRPMLVNHPEVVWREVRHPLLVFSLKGKRSVVPLSIDLSSSDRMLLVSGPNAGGKSVCLKTVGLVQYMVQCGLLVPLHPDSRVGIFQHLMLDIGDQQSIENDLSTYSSHLRNLAFFLREADENTLVLLDELGAGTDPNFGGGIAEAILKALLERKAWGVATTHYYNLKLFAERTAGIRNAAMQFDAQKLEPLFQLVIGKPGSSFALEIARKTGLPGETLREAEEIIGVELTGLETLLRKVEGEKLDVEKLQQELATLRNQAQQQRDRYQRMADELASREKEIINRAKAEAAQLLAQTNREIEKTIRHIKENKAEKKETKKVRHGLQQLSARVVVKPEQAVVATTPIAVGEAVRLRGQEVTGRVLSISGELAEVQFGDLRSTVKLSRLVKSAEAVSAQPAIARGAMNLVEKRSGFSPVLDVRGQRAEEVVTVLAQFLDDAVLLGQHELRIIHGKGEGVLRSIVRDRLKRMKEVVAVSDEHADRGGAGVTIVTLK
ncbi:MAG: endonuclease MutS2 [Cyclobacteriaceae bacterium]|jgi:DNA mismatch repair protein MutS2